MQVAKRLSNNVHRTNSSYINYSITITISIDISISQGATISPLKPSEECVF